MHKRKSNILKTVEKDMQERNITKKIDAAEDLGELELFSLRLPSVLKERLRKHFKRKGLALGAGIRFVLVEYLDDQ